jgi:Photosynthetic reaction centre cytochrome C subunit
VNISKKRDPAEGAIAVYDDKQKRILVGELLAIAGGAIVALGAVIALTFLNRTDLFNVNPNPVRGEGHYNYEGVQRVDYSTYLAGKKQTQVQPSAEAIAAYNVWVQANPQSRNIKVLSKYLGDSYNQTANVFGYMSAYFVPGVGVSCEYCHNLQDFSADDKPQKAIARNMLVMQFEVQNKWVGSLPKPEGQAAYQVVCATCHYGKPQGWNNALKLQKPGEFGIEGGGNPYNYELVDDQYLQTRVDGFGGVNYFQVQAKEVTNNDPVGLAGAARNQNAMYHVNSALQVGCDFCHYGGYFPSYITSDGTFKWPKAQARHMMGMVQDLSINWWPQLGVQNTAGPNCYMCHRGNVVPPGANANAPKPVVVGDPLITPLVALPIPKSVVPEGTK